MLIQSDSLGSKRSSDKFRQDQMGLNSHEGRLSGQSERSLQLLQRPLQIEHVNNGEF
ncbi:MAG: hypothetical protein ACJA2X_000951 [Halocynthiibacter sp.]|jgi:hypothetical protein